MAYKVTYNQGSRTGLASSVDCVIVHRGLEFLSAYAYATKSGTTYSFFKGESDTKMAFGIVLAAQTLAATTAGSRVLIDDGASKYRLATVTDDGTNTLVNGTALLASSRAATFHTDNAQVPAPVGTSLTYLGAGSGGQTWFEDPNGVQYIGNALTTAGAISPFTTAMVERESLSAIFEVAIL